jgi:hypothetical protein
VRRIHIARRTLARARHESLYPTRELTPGRLRFAACVAHSLTRAWPAAWLARVPAPASAGMRNKGINPEEDLGPSWDRRNFGMGNEAYDDFMPSADMRVHAGVLDHHHSLWGGGLRAHMAALDERAAKYAPVQEILFIGLSMGGALAELTAFHVACAFPRLTSCLRVLSFG